MAKNLFNPVMGSEERIKELGSSAGSVYFTTDTRKIYLDINDSKLPMGGNVGLFYGNMKLQAPVSEEQKEFEFKMTDIVGNEDGTDILVPNVNDLILNSDGCFYKVLSVDGNDISAYLNTEKLTIAGTGGGGGSSSPDDSDDLTSFRVGKFDISNKSVLQGKPCLVKFAVKSTNDVGEYIDGEVGFYELYINRIKQEEAKGIIKGIPYGEVTDNLNSFNSKDINTIDISPYLPISDNVGVKIVIFDNKGIQQTVRDFSVSVSSMNLTWDYDEKTLNRWLTDTKESMELEWSVSGGNLQKTTYITVDDSDFPYEIATGTDTNFTYTLNFADYNMTHGAHTVKMWAVAKVGTEEIPTDPIYKNIIVAKDDDSTTIISVCLFEKELTQYNTVSIPVYIYNCNNTAGTAIVNLVENGTMKDQWFDVPNLGADPIKSVWNYTPTIAGDAIILAVQSGTQEYTTTVAVTGIDIKITEKAGYAFKFKANEFSSNINVQNWGKASFSDRFDWINGGLKSEPDGEGGHRQYFAVKAGSTMTINYDMWAINAPANGKHFKFIFKATNCRDYDAQVLSCKADRKIISVDKTEEHYLLDNPNVELTYGDAVKIVNGKIQIQNLVTETLDITTSEGQGKLANKYVDFGELGIYQCDFLPINPDDPNSAKYNAWYKASIKDSFQGLLIKAQNAEINSNNETLDVQFCEDSYIELEVEVTESVNKQGYIKFWVDGVPTGYVVYDSGIDRFILNNIPITIGSPDCDVYIYLAKLYESELTVEEHMSNFYADAPNAEEMVRRYRRNDIMNDSMKTEIDMYKLAEANPDLLVHHYNVPRMPITKKDEVFPCSYDQYHGSRLADLTATGVMIKVQGTSSEKYVLAAANLDTDFNYTDNNNVPSGLIDTKTGDVLTDGWSMDGGTAIPVNFTCTKVNVASCENVNNAINQEWYNRFQPYKSVLRCKNPRARDTMQFTNGVIFVTDRSTKTDDSNGLTNNVFSDVVVAGKSYIDSPYAKMYSIGQMGNSKDNVHVFHDEDNPKECCIEVRDNQLPQQWMIDDDYNWADIGEKAKIFEFRYPDGVKNASQDMINGWNRLVSWMAHINPQPKYNKFENVTTESEYNKFAINRKTFTPIDVYVLNENGTEYIKNDGFKANISTYYTLTAHKYGYDNLPLNLPEEERTFDAKTFNGFIAEDQINSETEKPWQQNYTPMIRGCVVDTYAGTYTHDTYEYRMAKMLKECEDYLIMDSILYHYLFIERHCMIDNVAKNTFWSTEDCLHWNLIKDYDNDTADGTDNQGKFTRTYGMEPTDMLNPNAHVFNAHQSVWFNFCHGIKDACAHMYRKLENAKITDDNKTYYNVWDAQAYLKLCETWQKKIPERCWIEDYYRKYFRPNEVYKNKMFNSMLSGGQKKFKRKQYETYQDLYISSKYQGIKLTADRLLFRPTGRGLKKIKIPVEVYSDCYIYAEVGGQTAVHRVKRNTEAYLTCPVDELGNATMYIHPGSQFTKLGSLSGSGQLGTFAPDQMSFGDAKKLRELIFATKDMPTKNFGLVKDISFSGATLLEKLYIANLVAYNESLDLTDCTSLLELDASNSGFTGVKVAAGAPVTTIRLENPKALELSDLYNLQELQINSYNRLDTINLHNIDTTTHFSKNILSKALDMINSDDDTHYVQYHITDADWSIDSADEMNSTNIYILDKMLNPSYAQPALSQDEENRLPYSAAFTGTIKISDEAYSGSSPLTLYNKYITNTAFANVDMSFESNNATLYDVIIYNGDNVPHWKKKAVKNTDINSDFLSTGPNGAFNAVDLYKSPTAEFVYTFTNTWIVKDDSGAEIQTITGASPSGISIDRNLHIYPQFAKTKRSYWISIKQYNPLTKQTTELLRKQFEYGTNLNTILTANEDKIIPYIEDPSNSLGLYEGYDFKGFSLVSGSTILISENSYAVRGEDTLWAVFEFTKSINSIVHPEWFEVAKIAFNGENFDPYPELDSTYKIQGVYLKPASYALGGKITIPSTYEYNGTNYPVIGLTKFSDSGKRVNVSHVFVQSDENSSLYVIDDGCFRDQSTLKYFDFTNSLIRYIGANAFRSCSNLYLTTFGEVLYGIGETAFNSAIDDSITEFTIPGSVMRLEKNAFSNHLPNVPGLILNIGTEENKSNLLLAERNGQSAISADALKQNNKYETINFWTNQYSAPNEKISVSSSTTVADWFANGTLKAGGSLFVNGINNK